MKREENNTAPKKDANQYESPKIPRPTMQADGHIVVDPFGSWTGVPLDDPLDTPVQDVDDL